MTTTSRIYGLDATRAVLLVGGPLVHAVLPKYTTPALDIVSETSHIFRMAAFFAIAGFLVALNRHTDRPNWLSGRMRQLGIPMITMIVIMGILSFAVPYLYPGMSLIPYYLPGHLWFLETLIILSVITLAFERYKVNRVIVDIFDTRPWLLLPVFITLTLMMSFENSLITKMLPVAGIYIHEDLLLWVMVIFVHTPKYAVFYGLGFILARSESCLTFINRIPLIVSGFVALGISMVYYGQHGGTDVFLNRDTPRYIMRVLENVTPVLLCASIIAIALRIKQVPSAVLWFSNASYTVYLVHGVFIILVAYPLVSHYPTINPYLLYGILASCALLGGYAFHGLVKKSSLLLFLFNGKKLS